MNYEIVCRSLLFIFCNFDEVGKPGDLEAIGPDPEAAVDGAALFVGLLSRFVGAGLVLECTFEHGCVDVYFALDVHVPEAARTVGQLV